MPRMLVKGSQRPQNEQFSTAVDLIRFCFANFDGEMRSRIGSICRPKYNARHCYDQWYRHTTTCQRGWRLLTLVNERRKSEGRLVEVATWEFLSIC
jgi:hypothetical protein